MIPLVVHRGRHPTPFPTSFLSLLSLPFSAVSTRIAPPAQQPPRGAFFTLASSFFPRGMHVEVCIQRVGKRDPFFSSPCPLLPRKGASLASSETTRQRVHPFVALSLSLLLSFARVAAARKKQRKERHVASGRVPLLTPTRVHPIRVSPNARATRVDRRAKKVSQWVARQERWKNRVTFGARATPRHARQSLSRCDGPSPVP